MKNINEQFEEFEFDELEEIIDQKTLTKAIAIGGICTCFAFLLFAGLIYLILYLWQN